MKRAILGLTSLVGAGLFAASSAATAQMVGEDDFPKLLATAQGFTINPQRLDPYRKYNFRVLMDGRYISGIHYISPLRMRTASIDYREGGNQGTLRTTPGLTTYPSITMKRGLTHAREFQNWVDAGGTFGARRNLNEYLKDIRIELFNEAGQVAHAWNLYRCWPSEYVPVSGMNALKPELAEESLTIRCDGWERDRDIREPSPR
ncbi:MAG: phage tail protein [Parvularculaceae bacterium]|nr:phage tail protein [Parvularculaceae bacterium]